LEFAQHVLVNAARLWAESGANQKQRLQNVIFPQGVFFLDGVYRTTTTSRIFFELEGISLEKERLVVRDGTKSLAGCAKWTC
jgi:hypothetical protein